MSIEIGGSSGQVPHEALEAGKAQSANPQNAPVARTSPKGPGGGPDQFRLSDQASQLKALESEIANLPVVDAQRVQDVQRTLATGSFQMEPAQVAQKLLTFEAGLNRAQ